MSRWREVGPLPGPRGESRGARIVRAAVPVGLVGLLVLVDRVVLAAVVLTTATLLAVLTHWRPVLGARLLQGFGTFGRVVAHGLSWFLLAIVQLVIVTPAAALSRAFRRDPLATTPAGATSVWLGRPTRTPSRRTFGRDAATRPVRGRAARTLGRVPVALGAVVLLVGLNYALGWVWDEYVGSHDVPAGLFSTAAGPSPLADAPAIADDDWAPAYWAEYDRLRHDPVPFLLTRVADVSSRDINSRAGVRRTYRAPSTTAAAPEIWLLGGGAAWGEGQRDDHTIASEIARLAEATGTPVRILNLGQPGYTTWQTALLVEQQLAVRPAPDLVVFYDGADDVAVQLEERHDAPSHYNADGVGIALTGRDSAADQAQDLWAEYQETSVVTRLAQGLGGFFGAQPAGAADDELVDRVLDLRERSRPVIESVTADHDVDVLLTWQAATGVPGDDGAYRQVAAQDPDDATVDLSTLLDDRAEDVFLDGVLTDEDGARLVAAALWAEIAGRLA